MGVQNLTPHIKPMPWPIDLGQIALGWDWHRKHVSCYSPLWRTRGRGSFIWEKDAGWVGPATVGGNVTDEVCREGRGPANPNNAELTWVHHLGHNTIANTPFSVYVRFRIDEVGATGDANLVGTFGGTSNGYWALSREDDFDLVFRWHDGGFQKAVFTDAFLVAAVGDIISIGVACDGLGDVTAWYKGKNLGTVSSGLPLITTGTDRTMACGAASSATPEQQGLYLAFYIYNDYELNDAQNQQLHRDPYGPIRPDLRTIGKAAAVAGGRIMSSLAHHGGLAGMGGIAGAGGGLAA